MKELLLKISHPNFTLSIVGPRPIRESYALSRIGDTKFDTTTYPILLNGVDVANLSSFCKIEAFSMGVSHSVKIEYLAVDDGGYPLPFFFEHIDYSILLECRITERIYVWHENSDLISNLSEFDKIISGTVNFQNNVGETTFIIQQNTTPLLRLTFIVYSTKLNFFTQRRVMLTEVQRVHNAILFDLFKPTKERASSTSDRITGIEWLTLFFQSSDSILKLVKRIENKAHSKLHSKIELKKIFKLKASNKQFIKRVEKHGHDEVLKMNKIWSDKKVITTDTSENRYIKFLLLQMIKAGKKWINFITEFDTSRGKQIQDSEYYNKLKANIHFLERHLKNNFWTSIKIEHRNLENRGNFGFHNEFIKTEHFARKLKRGLLFDISGSERIYVLSMERLYELWTYVKIAEIISIITKNDPEAIRLKARSTEFETSIITGRYSRVEIADNISIQTNRLFTQESSPYRVPLVNQKPDIILELLHKNQLILFDAKYKINVLNELPDGRYEILSNKDLMSKRIDGALLIMPNDNDINVIHRYRDAIYLNRETNYKHVVVKGYILFPGFINKESLEKSKDAARYFGVAYLPFSPGDNDLDWFADTPLKFDRHDRPTNTEDIRAVAEALNEILAEHKTEIV
jgi:uncharacterized protein